MITVIQFNFNYNDMAIDEANFPVAWKNTERCFKVSISYRVKYIIKEIKVTAEQLFTSGAETYPAGDTVATFRILVPDKYEFMRSYQWNPECCKDGTPAERQPDYCDPFPPSIEYKLYPLPEKWKYKFGFGLQYDWGKYKKNE